MIHHLVPANPVEKSQMTPEQCVAELRRAINCDDVTFGTDEVPRQITLGFIADRKAIQYAFRLGNTIDTTQIIRTEWPFVRHGRNGQAGIDITKPTVTPLKITGELLTALLPIIKDPTIQEGLQGLLKVRP